MAHEIAKAIIWGLNNWQNPNEATDPPDTSYVRDQEALGWDQFMDGWPMHSWHITRSPSGIVPRAIGLASDG